MATVAVGQTWPVLLPSLRVGMLAQRTLRERDDERAFLVRHLEITAALALRFPPCQTFSQAAKAPSRLLQIVGALVAGQFGHGVGKGQPAAQLRVVGDVEARSLAGREDEVLVVEHRQ